MKKIIFTIMVLIFFACKETKKVELNANLSSTKDTTSRLSDKKSLVNNIDNKNSIFNCNAVLIELVKSSTLTNPFKEKFTIEFDEITKLSFKITMYDADNVVGNLLFDAKNLKLLDLTNDSDKPEELSFDEKKWNSIIDCYFNKNQKFYIGSNKKSDCITKEMGMDFEETCLINDSTIEAVYLDLIKKKLIYNSNELLKNVPLKSEIININANGLVSITYKVNVNLVEIEMFYDGGITNISIKKNENNVQRIIFSSAD